MPFIRHVVILAVVIWGWLHAMILMAMAMAGDVGPEVLRPGPGSALLVCGAVVTISLAAMRRRNEDLLLANLGIDRGQVAAGLAVLVLALEGALWWVLP